VVQCLAGRLCAVVATDTAAGYGCVIHKSDRAPARSDVAIRAFSRRHNMIGRFRRRSDKSVLRMAIRTTGIGWAEDRTNMACFAGNVRVRAVQNKPCTEVIKSLLRLCRELYQQKNEKRDE